jgi:hypothetical protein
MWFAPSLIYKRGANPPPLPRGEEKRKGTQAQHNWRQAAPRTCSPILSQHLQPSHQGLGSQASSPALLVAAPLQAPPVLSNIVPWARHCWTYSPLSRNQDKTLCHLLLSIDHWGIDHGAYYWLVSGPYSAPTIRSARLRLMQPINQTLICSGSTCLQRLHPRSYTIHE